MPEGSRHILLRLLRPVQKQHHLVVSQSLMALPRVYCSARLAEEILPVACWARTDGLYHELNQVNEVIKKLDEGDIHGFDAWEGRD